MKITIRELRQRIVESIGTYDAIKFGSNREYIFIVLLDAKDNFVAGMNLTADDENGEWYTVNTLWSSSMVAAVVLLETALADLQKINPSDDISPAAQSVIKRWAMKNWQNGCVVEDPGTEEEHAINDPPTKSMSQYGFKAPPSGLSRAIPIRKPFSEEERVELKKTFVNGFRDAYAERSKKNDYALMLKLNMTREFLTAVRLASADHDEPEFVKAQEFVAANKKKIEGLLKSSQEDSWRNILVKLKLY